MSPHHRRHADKSTGLSVRILSGSSAYRSTMNFATRVWSEKCTTMT